MARTIHSNRSQRLWKQTGCVEWEDIFRKRRIKKNVKDERKKSGLPIDGPSVPSAVAVELKNEHPCLYFPVTIEEVREVFEALPPGTLTGLAAVLLEAGTTYINSLPEEDLQQDDEEDEIILDPFLGRRGYKVSPEVYLPVVSGNYNPQDNVIRLFGIAAQPPIQLRPGEIMILRFNMMKTLLHEIAHHHDWTQRVARGRWLMDDEEKSEQYAKGMARHWGEGILSSYIEELVAEIMMDFED